MRGVTPTGAKRKPKRLLTWSATRVADLIHRRGALLRVALGKPLAAAALPSAPSMIEENAALTATIALRDQKIDALERELQVCRPERANFADRHQKALKRAARKRAARNELKEAQQRGYSEAQKAARAAQLATRKRNFDAAVERASYVRVVMLTKKLERANKKLADAGLAHVAALEEKAKQVSTARKRARKVENAAKKLDATQETLKAAKAEAKELRARCESESESESDEEEGGGAAQQRRNQRGRFQAGDWRQRLTALSCTTSRPRGRCGRGAWSSQSRASASNTCAWPRRSASSRSASTSRASTASASCRPILRSRSTGRRRERRST